MEKLNATTVYVLSIISFLCCCLLGSGVLLAGPAFYMANNKLKEADANPGKYEESSVKAMNTAKIVALVALVINGLYLVYSIYSIATTDFSAVMDQYRQILEQRGA